MRSTPAVLRAYLRRPLPLLAGVTVGLLSGMAAAQGPRTPPISGTVVALHGQQLEVDTTEAGPVTVTLAAQPRVIEQLPATLAQVRAGRFIGATAVEQTDGQLQATEIHIFPDSMRGTGEGHYPMGAPNTTMTNGNIESVLGNVTVPAHANAAAVGGPAVTAHQLTLRVDYKGGQSTIEVPRDVTVTMMRAGSRRSLRPGAHVTVIAQPGAGGQLTAGLLIVHERAAD